MKTASILIPLLFLIAIPLLGDAAKPADEKAVLAAEKQLAAAMVKADVATIEKLLDEGLSYTHSAALTETKAQFLQAIRSGSTKYDAVEYNETKIRQYGNTVITNHKMTFRNPPNTVNKLFVTMVWTKQGGGWVLVNRQATRLPAE